jgi:hypothetical protein
LLLHDDEYRPLLMCHSHSELVDDWLLTVSFPAIPHACGLLLPGAHELVDDWLLIGDDGAADSTDSWLAAANFAACANVAPSKISNTTHTAHARILDQP